MTKYRLGPAVTDRVSQLHDGGAILARRYGRWLTGIQTPPPAPPTDDDGLEEDSEPEEKPKKGKKKAKGKKADKTPEKDATEAGEQPDEKGPRRSLASALRRIAGSGGVAYLGAQAVATSTWLLWPTTIAALTAAYRAGAPDGEQQDDAAPDEPEVTEDDPAEDEPSGPDGAAFAEVVRELIGAGPGVHLAEIPPALAARWPHRQWDSADVRALAGAAGLPIAGTRSATRSGSSTGIRRRDLPPPPAADPAPDGVVAAGQPANNDSNNDAIAVERGGAVTILRRASDAARHHTIRSTP